MRNEILEQGQEVILYLYTNWTGRARGTGTLVKKMRTSDIGSELWEVNAGRDNSSLIGHEDIWWLGKVNCFGKI